MFELIFREAGKVCAFTREDVHFLYWPDTNRLFRIKENAFQALEKYSQDSIENDLTVQIEQILSMEKQRLCSLAEDKKKLVLKEETYGLCFFLTHRCNLKCVYCFDRYADKADSADTSLIKGYIEQCAGQYRELAVFFMGGEPLLKFPKIVEIVSYCEQLKRTKNVRIAYSVTTNGQLLTREMADFFNRFLFTVVLSVDGCYDGQKNTVTGQREKIYPADKNDIIKMLDNKIVRVTVIPETIKCMYELFKKLKEYGTSAIEMMPAVDSSFSYSRSDSGEWTRQICRIWTDLCGGDNKCILLNVESAKKRIQDKRRTQGCKAGIRMTSIDVDGTQYPCHRMAALGKKYSTAVYEPSEKKGDACRQCWAANVCRNICLYERSCAGEDMRSFLCEIYKEEVKLAFWALYNSQKGLKKPTDRKSED